MSKNKNKLKRELDKINSDWAYGMPEPWYDHVMRKAKRKKIILDAVDAETGESVL